MLIEYLVFLSLSFCILLLNKRMRGTYFSITSFLIVPYCAVLGIQTLCCYLFGTIRPQINYWFIILCFFLVTFVSDITAHMLFKNFSKDKNRVSSFQQSRSNNSNNYVLDILFFLISSFCILSFVYYALRMPSLHYVVQSEFQNLYGTNFYLKLILMLGVTYYWGTQKISLKTIFLGFLCLIPIILSFVKGIIFIPCIASILLRIERKDIRMNFKSVSFIVLSAVFVFFGVYLIEFAIYGIDALFNPITYKNIFVKFIQYLISGAQSFSQNLVDNVDAFRSSDNASLAPLMNLLSKIGIGQYVNNVSSIYQPFSFSGILEGETQSNVNGYVGTLYLYNGLFFGNVINFVWVFFASLLQEYYSKRNDCLGSLSGLYIAPFALGCFEYYFLHSFWIYLILLGILINMVSKVNYKIRLFHKSNT